MGTIYVIVMVNDSGIIQKKGLSIFFRFKKVNLLVAFSILLL